jgi:hypothetical protein
MAKNGVPTGRKRKPRSVDAAIGLDGILKAVQKTDLNGDDAMRIVNALKSRGLINVSIVRAGKGSVLFAEFLETFWDYTASPLCPGKAGSRPQHRAPPLLRELEQGASALFLGL